MGTLIVKELLAHLYGFRFVICLVLVPVLFAVSGFVFVKRYEADLDRYNQMMHANAQGVREHADKLGEIMWYDQKIMLSPNVLELCAAGHQRTLPAIFTTDANESILPEVSAEANFLLPDFADIDWVFLVSTVVSLLAFLLGYDMISGEREAGSLRAILSNSVSRSSVLLSKYIAALIVLVIPLLLGVLFSLIIVLQSGGAVVDAGVLLRMGVIVLLSLLVLSLCLLLALTVSSYVKSSTTSIVILLLIWGAWLFVIPGVGGMVARRSAPLPTPSEIEDRIIKMYRQIWDEETAKDPRLGYWGPDPTRRNPQGRVRIRKRIMAMERRMRSDHLREMIRQARCGLTFARFSPFVLYASASEAVAGTGVFRVETAWEDLNRYREDLLSSLVAQFQLDLPTPYHIFLYVNEAPYSDQPVDPDLIPQFRERRRSVAESIAAVPMDVALLVLLNVILFMVANASFIRADVR